MVDATGILTFGLWTPEPGEGTGENVYITQLEVTVEVADITAHVEVDSS